MFSKMSGKRVEVKSSEEASLDDMMKNGVRGKPDIAGLAAIDGRKVSIMAWYYHDDDLPGPDAAVEMTLHHLPVANGSGQMMQYRIDRTHSNPFTVWQGMGSPTAPNRNQYTQLLQAGQLSADSGLSAESCPACNLSLIHI